MLLKFSEAKKAGLSNLPNQLRLDLEYLEQLASTTSTDISSWPIAMVVDCKGDKRAINKLFFSRGEAKPGLTEEQQKLLDTVTAQISAASKAAMDSLITTERDNATYYLEQAHSYYTNFERKVLEAIKSKDKIRIMLGAPDNTKDEVCKILKNPFWEYLSHSDQHVTFATKSPVILTERNDAAGINRRVEMGTYKVAINLVTPVVNVYPLLGNKTFEGYYHPYVAASGKICWGHSTETATKLLTDRKFSDVMTLLSALLTTYSPDTTPYQRLVEFENPGAPRCENCENPEDECSCDRCSVCEELSDNCDCHYCEACDERYADGDSCSGNYCEACQSCTGSNRCEEHWCSICEDYRLRDGECRDGCCNNCDSVQDDCHCCPECDRQDNEHESGCANAPQPVTEESPF